MRVDVGCSFTYLAEIPTPVIFQIQPDPEPAQRVRSESWSVNPFVALHDYEDLYGNPCMRTVLPPGRTTVRYSASVEVPDGPEQHEPETAETAPADLPDPVLLYTLPSRYCLPDVLADEAWTRFGGLAPGFGRVLSICAHVHNHLSFRYGSTTALSTAADVNASGLGVCRDFTHLAITFCRALNIPARYVFGYLPDIGVPAGSAPMDFAAWMEVWLGDRWWTFDPRNNARRAGRVVIGRGRDAADVAMATTFGGPTLEEMTVHAERSGGRASAGHLPLVPPQRQR
ncbi:transglutaminase family protein [Actinophytocola sp. NPDC049390]|uniref:transglutaminase family protein n=1 Tax=Actinophytocola sp. NPDC049390 TaxID=3363894 RepID=UPI0037B564F0